MIWPSSFDELSTLHRPVSLVGSLELSVVLTICGEGSHPSAPRRTPYETAAALLAAPLDKPGDLFRWAETRLCPGLADVELQELPGRRDCQPEIDHWRTEAKDLSIGSQRMQPESISLWKVVEVDEAFELSKPSMAFPA
jgi:hypothetical protein